jgi:four helix bundle protein
MQNPSNLRVFVQAEELAVLVHRLARTLPLEERFALSQQMRRAAVSIGSNIAEGCGRGGNKELLRFLSIALGSATELEFQLRIAHRLGYGDEATRAETVARTFRVQRMLTRLITRLRPALGASRGRP